MRRKPCHRDLNRFYGLAGLRHIELAALCLVFVLWRRCGGHVTHGAIVVGGLGLAIRGLRQATLPGAGMGLAVYLLTEQAMPISGRDWAPPFRPARSGDA